MVNITELNRGPDISANAIDATSVTTNSGTVTNLDGTDLQYNEVAVSPKSVRVYPREEEQTFYDIEVIEQGADANLIPTLQDINDNQLSTNGSVVIGPGDYWVNNGDTLTWNVGGDIRGSGRSSTSIRRTDPMTGYMISILSNGSTVSDMFLNGNGAGEHALLFDGAREASTERVTISGWGGRGFELRGSSYFHTARSLLVGENNQSGLVEQQVLLKNDGTAGPHTSVFIAPRIEQGNACAGFETSGGVGDITFIGGSVENNDGAGGKVSNGFGFYLKGTRFEGNNQATTEDRFYQAAGLVIAADTVFKGFIISGRFSAGPNANANISLGDQGEAGAGKIQGCRFSNNATGTGADILDGTIGNEGIHVTGNSHGGNAILNNRKNGMFVNGLGREKTGGATPTSADWPIGAIVADADTVGDVYMKLSSGWTQIGT